MGLLGTDTSGTEPVSFLDPAHTVHRLLLVERGMHLIEILNLDEPADAKVDPFLFVCLPLKVRGATGWWVRPSRSAERHSKLIRRYPHPGPLLVA
jgi:kynurenine formamidase